MDIVGLILMCVGTVGSLVSGIWLLICAFKKSVLWGLAYLFLPFASLVYLFVDWKHAQKPFLVGLVAIATMAGGIALSPTAKEALSKGSSSTSTSP